MGIGGDDLPGQWDDELSTWPEDRRRVAARRIAFVAVCGALITLIILTIVFVGNDKTSTTEVTTNTNPTSSSTPGTIGFATALPVAATATSFGTTTSSIETTTTTLPPRTTTTTTTLATTTTAPLPAFKYNGQTPKAAVGTFSAGNASCQPSTGETFQFNTPSPGTLTIRRSDTGIIATGPVSPSGGFDITGANGPNVSERYVGTTTQTGASGTFIATYNPGCPGGASYAASWTWP